MMSRRLVFGCVGILGLAVATPVWAFDMPAQKLELVDHFRQAAERGDRKRFAGYMNLLEAQVAQFEQAFHISPPADPPSGRLPDIAGAFITGWACLLTDSLAAEREAPDSAWRVVLLLLAGNKDWMLRADPKLYNHFQRSVSELRVVSDEQARAAIRSDLLKRVGELMTKTLSP